MGKFWKNDNEVYDVAETLARRLAGLANKEGIAYGPDAMSAMRMALHANATDFLSLDPQKILDEWDRMRRVAMDIGVDISETVTVELGATRDHLADWHGAGADAFHKQVDQMRAFTGSQFEYVVKTIQALGPMLRVAVQSREDFTALAQATIDQVDKVFEDDQDARSEFVLKVGNGLAKAVLGVIADPKKAFFAVAENVMDIAVEGVTQAMEGGKLGDLVSNYTKQRDRLLQGYESELNQITQMLKDVHEGVVNSRVEMFDPLPVDLNVNSPDFRYETFMSKDVDAAQFGPRVEAERRKYIAEKQHNLVNPNSPIYRRLAGS
jgi:hypothetical protein